MLAGSVVIFGLVLALLLYAVLRPPERRRPVPMHGTVMMFVMVAMVPCLGHTMW